MSTPSTRVTRELVRMACYAPSVHNTQPWKWRIVDPTTVELYADRSRQLPHLDPTGRDLAISCGAALHHLIVAAEGFGQHAQVDLLPDAEDTELLARVHLTPGTLTDRAPELLAALENRVTDRRGFSTWPVPVGRLRHLAEQGEPWGAHVHALTDPGDVRRAETLLDRALSTQQGERDVVREQDRWVEHGYGAVDGIPARHAAPEQHEGTSRRTGRFDAWAPSPVVPSAPGDHPDGLLVVFTAEDDLRAWLRTGMTVSAVWIEATRHDLTVAPQTQLVEVEETREQLRHGVFDGMGWPQVLLRVGFPQTSEPPMQRTPRRELDDVLLP